MSWNAARGSIFQRAAPYLRIIATLKPDVILFQELSERNSAAQLQSLLEQTRTTDQNEHWNVLLGSGGGNLRCAIASRKPLKPVDALALVPVPGQPDRSIRVVGGAVEVDGGIGPTTVAAPASALVLVGLPAITTRRRSG